MKKVKPQKHKNSGLKEILSLNSFDTESLIYRVMPEFLMEIMEKYFRLRIEGLENIPKTGPALITPNHSGYLGFDAFLLRHELCTRAQRTPKVLTHHLWFFAKATALPAQKLGFIEATIDNANDALQQGDLVVLFPEGEKGNFKPSLEQYTLQEFKRGFVRLALKNQAPIIPTLIIGAEESHINLSQLKLTKYLRGLILPLPLNIIPLPAKWTIKFLKPIAFPFGPEAAEDQELVHELAEAVQEEMQEALNALLLTRQTIYF